MAEPLFLESLEIQQFRAFKHLRIERLGRVNLIVGRNNVGKSSLLEALWLYAHQAHPVILWKILETRNEGKGPEQPQAMRIGTKEEERIEDYSDSVKQIFHRNTNSSQPYWAKIGPIGIDSKTLKIALGSQRDTKTNELTGVIKTQFEDKAFSYNVNVGSYRLRDGNGERCVMVVANGLDVRTVEKFWDNIALTSLEDDVLNALRLIAPNVERVNLLAGRRGRMGRTPVVKLAGEKDPIPLRSLGEGMNRMFGIALALVSAKDGVLLIDEIESGLHFSVQPDIWRLVFEVAHRLNVQVFATTHSWDCLTAFQEAAKVDEQEEGVLIRLLERNGKITTVQFDEEELEVVAREGIEVR
jgi:AAA15 family ATPase/GTPase